MSSQVGKKIGDAISKASKSVTVDLKRRKNIADTGLTASKDLNTRRITKYIDFKARKQYAIKKMGLKLNDFESIKEHVDLDYAGCREESPMVAAATLKEYSESIAVEKIAHAALKASTLLNWKCDKKRKWGNLADAGFKPGNYNLRMEIFSSKSRWRAAMDGGARKGYTCEEFGVFWSDIDRLSNYAQKIFKISPYWGGAFACQAIAVESILNTAEKSLNEFYAIQNQGNEPTQLIDWELHGEKRCVTPFKYWLIDAEDKALKQCEKETNSDDDEVQYDEVGFMDSRDEMSIFVDSNEAREQIARVSSLYSKSSSLNWSRIIKFMEFKARKEFAMEMYGVKLGDFESLKENAFKLFEISEEEAAKMASETMAMDFQSLVIEKIADAAFKSSKILNWVPDSKKYSEIPERIFADAGFKSPKSLMYFSKYMQIDACMAYTMETFQVHTVDIQYLKDFAVDAFYCFADEILTEGEVINLALQSIAIDKLFDATSKALTSSLHNNQLVEPKEAEDEEKTKRAMLRFDGDDIIPMHDVIYFP